MKQTKKPTRDQKALILKNDLDVKSWRVVSEDKSTLVVMNASGEVKTLSKGGKR